MQDVLFAVSFWGLLSAFLLYVMFLGRHLKAAVGLAPIAASAAAAQNGSTHWYPPRPNWTGDLADVVNGTGVHGFIFNGSSLPENVEYGTYNWCNMPHVRPAEYPRAPPEYELDYVELIHRHHKRTPYADNTFPRESYPWFCDDEGLFFYGSPLNPPGREPAPAYWRVYTSPINPFAAPGFNGTCQFPQITRGGLDDSFQHGADIAAVYRDLLGFLPPATPGTSHITFRVTNNVITSQVAGMAAAGTSAHPPVPLAIQPPATDSLEPRYPCPRAAALLAQHGPGSADPAWTAHLAAAAPLLARLDAASGVPATDDGFHRSLDHYFDNLSARQCHAKQLPCAAAAAGDDPPPCVRQPDADAVYRLGQHEYAFLYRAGGAWGLEAAAGAFGVWVAELAESIRGRVEGRGGGEKLRYNIAHDGSVSRLLSVLQVEEMVWPGMGAEVVFELFRRKEESGGGWFVRILWGGKVLVSSVPEIGRADMVEVGVLLGYFDGLVGRGAEKVRAMCGAE